MRVSSISSYKIYNNISVTNSKKQVSTNNIKSDIQKETPNFKASHFYKVAGFIAGTALCTLFAPGLAMIGLAGLGAGTGSLIGAAVDEQIDESDASKDKNNYD